MSEVIEAKETVEFVERYTSAPETYDWFGTQSLGDSGYVMAIGKGGKLRKVAIPADDSRIFSQEGRYGSGLYVSLSDTQLQEWLADGVVVVDRRKADRRKEVR